MSTIRKTVDRDDLRAWLDENGHSDIDVLPLFLPAEGHGYFRSTVARETLEPFLASHGCTLDVAPLFEFHVARERLRDPERPARIAEAVRLYRDEGHSLAEVGEAMGVTRECVRLYLQDAGVTGRHYGARRRSEEQARRDATVAGLVARRDEMRALYFACRNIPAFAAKLGVTDEIAKRVREQVVNYDEWRLAKSGNDSVRWTDEQLASILHEAVAKHGEPLSHDLYNEIAAAEGWPTHQTFALRWGSWRDACLACDVQANPKSGPSKWIGVDDCLAAIKTLTAELGRVPTYSEYVLWARREGKPCGAIVRRRLGGWKNVIRGLSTEIV